MTRKLNKQFSNVGDLLLHYTLMQQETKAGSPTHQALQPTVLSSAEAQYIPLTQKLKLTVSKKDQGCHRQCLTLAV